MTTTCTCSKRARARSTTPTPVRDERDVAQKTVRRPRLPRHGDKSCPDSSVWLQCSQCKLGLTADVNKGMIDAYELPVIHSPEHDVDRDLLIHRRCGGQLQPFGIGGAN